MQNRWQNRNQGRNQSNSNSRPLSNRESSLNQKRDWYERDPMDEKSGYRDEQKYAGRNMNSQYGYGSDDSGYTPSRRTDRSSRNEQDFDTFSSRSSSAGDYYRPSDADEYESSYSRSGGSDFDRYNQQDHGAYSSQFEGSRMTQGQGAYGTPSSSRNNNQWESSRQPGHYGASQGHRGAGDFTPNRYDSQNRSSSSSYGSGGYYGPDRSSSFGSGSEFGGGSSYGQDFGRSQSNETSYGLNSGTNRGSGGSAESSMGSHAGRGPKGFKRSDERIKEEVCEMLTRHHAIDADDIDVEVKDGEVTLTGSVSERRMKHLAEDVVEQCYGVKDVTNNIRVKRSEDTESLTSSANDRKSSSTSMTGTSGKKSVSGGSATTDGKSLPN